MFDAQVNVLGTLNVLQQAVKHGVRKVIFSSSGGAIYGEQETYPAPETHVLKPLSPYGLSKLCGEQYLSYFQRVSGLQAVSLRYANVYGPRQDPEGEAGVVAEGFGIGRVEAVGEFDIFRPVPGCSCRTNGGARSRSGRAGSGSGAGSGSARSWA